MKHSVVVAAAVALVIIAAAPCRADWEAGLAAYNRGDFETAATEIAKYVAQNPTDPRYAIAYYLLGSSYLQLDRTDDGIAKLRRAVELDPAKPDYGLALGRVLLGEGQAADARVVLEAADSSAMSDEQRLTRALLLASAALELAEPERALSALEAQLPAAEESADLHRAIGLACYRLGDRERAFTELSTAYDLAPGDAASGRNAVLIALDLASGETLPEAEREWHRKASVVAAKLATAEPTPANLVLAARAAEGAGRDVEASAWLAKAFEAAPEDAQLAYDLGRSLAASGDDHGALAALARGLELEPDADLAVRIHRQIAKIHARNLELDAAVRHFERAGDQRAADQIEEIAGSFADAIARRADLVAKIAELRTMEAELEALNDSQGVAAVRGRADAMQSELDAIDANLASVREALKNL